MTRITSPLNATLLNVKAKALDSVRSLRERIYPSAIPLTVVDVPLVEFMCRVFTRMPGESYRRPLRSLLLYLCYVFRAPINSLVRLILTVVFIVICLSLSLKTQVRTVLFSCVKK